MTTEPSYAQQQYEVLREHVLEAHSWRGHGLLLFLTQGMAAWLSALSVLVPPPTQGILSSEAPWNVPPLLPSGRRSELTRVLADMVLACSGEAVR